MSLITCSLKQLLTCEHTMVTKAKQHNNYSRCGLTSDHKRQTSTELFYLMSSQWQLCFPLHYYAKNPHTLVETSFIPKCFTLCCRINIKIQCAKQNYANAFERVWASKKLPTTINVQWTLCKATVSGKYTFTHQCNQSGFKSSLIVYT